MSLLASPEDQSELALAASPFVGREAEVRELELALDRTVGGAGQVVLLLGEPGIGKTRLAEMLATHARERQALVLSGNCHEWEGAPAYWPWTQVLRGWFRTLSDQELQDTLGHDAALIAQIVPDLRARFPDSGIQTSAEPEEAFFRLIAAVSDAVRGGAKRQPLVFVLEDIHWADQSSLMLLRFLAQEVRDSAVLLLATCRSGELGRQHPATAVLADLGREPHCRRLTLRGLSKPQVARYVALVTGRPQDQRLVDAVFEETAGNPFFVAEVVRLLADEERLGGSGVAYFRRTRVPESVREAVGRRLARLSPACNRALAGGAVIGREFDARILGRVLSVPSTELLDALDEAVRANLLVPSEQAGTFRFSHALVQETLYHDLSLAERAQLHLAVSEALEAGDAQALPWAALTYHLLGARPLGDLNKLVRYAQRSGDEAMAQFAWEAAATHFAHALRALEQSDVNDSTLRCDLLLDLGEAYNRSGPGSGDVPRAREHFLEAFQLARELGSPERMARAAVGFAGLNIVTAFGGVRQLQLLEDALAALDPADSPLRVRALCNLAVDLWNRSTANYERCSALSDEAVAMARRLGDPALIALALWARHYSGWQPVNLAERLVLAQQLVDYADMSGAPVIAAWAYVSLSLDYTDAGNLPDAERAIAALRRLDERTRIPYVALRAAVYGGMLELLTGHYAAAIESVARAEALWESDTPRQHQIQTYCLLRDLGRLSELRDGIRLPDPSNPWRAATQAHRMLLALDRGQSEAAHADYADLAKDDFAQVGFNAFWFGAVVPLAEAAIAFGDTVNAARLCALLEPFAERLAFVGILGVCHGPVALYLGRLATALGDWETADKRLEQALAMSERLAIRPYIARTLLARAELFARRQQPGDDVLAHTCAQRAADVAAAIGMAGLPQPSMALRATLSPRRIEQFGLTARELDVLRLVAAGKTDAEVADALFISPRTVGTHLTSVYTKLNVSSRAMATRVALEHALI